MKRTAGDVLWRLASARELVACLIAATAARLLLPWRWGVPLSLGDELLYLQAAESILRSGGMAERGAWLWAPGYPYMLALSLEMVGSPALVRWLQIAASVAGLLLVRFLAQRVGGRRAALAAGWIYALHPTLSYFAFRLWVETLYATLLVALVASVVWSRERSGAWGSSDAGADWYAGWWRGVAPGAVLGICILFRGAAVLLVPIAFLVHCWPDRGWVQGVRRYGLRALVAIATAVLVVLPYSVHATQRYGSLVISDATLGRMMFLGNNGFSPMSFDLNNPAPRGLRVKRSWLPCHKTDPELNVVRSDRCGVARGMAWIRDEPLMFVKRIPLRLAQTLNPHSFLTRSIARDEYPGMPGWLALALLWLTVAFSFVVAVGGIVGLTAFPSGPIAAATALIVGYHLATNAALAGLSRYLVQCVPLWIVFVGVAAARPTECWVRLRRAPLRAAACALLLTCVIALMLWMLPTGIEGIDTWRARRSDVP